jgi:hypothetical protein
MWCRCGAVRCGAARCAHQHQCQRMELKYDQRQSHTNFPTFVLLFLFNNSRVTALPVTGHGVILHQTEQNTTHVTKSSVQDRQQHMQHHEPQESLQIPITMHNASRQRVASGSLDAADLCSCGCGRYPGAHLLTHNTERRRETLLPSSRHPV